jgi:N-acetylneuraminic acid mutarotase
MKNRQILLVLLISIFSSQFALNQGTWTQKKDFEGTPRVQAVGFSIGTKGYILTGFDYDSLRSDLWEWDQETDTWTQKAPFEGTPRKGSVGFSIGNKGYIGTGEDKDSLRSDFWEWDQETDTWLRKTDFGGNARAYAVGFSIGDKGYIGTGEDGISTPQGNSMDFWEYNQANDVWAKKTDFAGGRRRFATGFSVGGKGYIVLGGDSDNGVYYSDLWEWDPQFDTWTQKTDFPSANSGRVGSTSFVIGNNAYVGTGYYLCGTECTVICNDLFTWASETDSWHKEADLELGTFAAVSFSIGEKGYLGAGYYFPGRSDFWEYCPECNMNEILDLNSSSIISISPNPLTSHSIMRTNVDLDDATLLFYNSVGQQVLNISNIYGQTLIIDRKNLSSGIYYLHLMQDHRTIATCNLLVSDN